MATYRIGIGTEFKLDGGVGIGTDTVSGSLGDLRVEGTFKTNDLDVTGVSTFTRYAGFAADNINVNYKEDLSLTGEHSTQGDIVVGLNSTFTVSTGATVTVGTVESVSIGTHFSPPIGRTEDRPEAVHEGTVRFNKDLNTLEFYNGLEWRQFTVSSPRGRGLNRYKPDIDYFEISTLGNSVSFGTGISNTNGGGRSGSSSTRGIFFGGSNPSNRENIIDYVTIQSAGNAIDFGDMTRVAKEPMDAMCSSTRMLMPGGKDSSYTNIIDFVEMQTLGNAVDFGDMKASGGYGGSTNSHVRGIYGGGETAPNTNSEIIYYVTIAAKGNSTDFGDLTFKTRGIGGAGNSVRGIFAGGELSPLYVPYSIQYITIASTGNAQYFGDITVPRGSGVGGCSNNTRAVFSGGEETPGVINVIDYVTITSTGNAADFGDLSQGVANCTSCSDSHGGLGGY